MSRLDKETVVALAEVRRRKQAEAERKAAAARARSRPSGEKAINWKKAPRFLAAAILIFLVVFGVQWVMRLMNSVGGVP